MQFNMVFTNQDVEWSTRTARINGADGSKIFELHGVEAPTSWSDTAVNIVASKYFKKIDGAQETSVKGIIKRVVDKIVEWGNREQYFSDEASSDNFRHDLTYILVNQYGTFNTPVWLNFGVPNRPQTGSACFLLDVEDTMQSIDDWMSLESKIFVAGSGAGVNVSSLRPTGAPLSAGGSSSGPMSFVKAADARAGAIKSGGVSRRAAKLVIMDADHSDILQFIESKSKEENKARVLIEAGYGSEIDGEAYGTVAHQNANYSVRVDDGFMERACSDPGSKEANILDAVAKAAHACGDPGLIYKDNILKYYTIPASGLPKTGNPCLEILSQPVFTSCNLGHVNLLKFLDGKEFKWDLFFSVVDIMTVALDIICLCSEYPDERIAANTRNQHHISLGYSNLGALLMVLGLPYDSDSARKVAAEISAALTGEAFLMSANMAEKIGAFKEYALGHNKQTILSVIEKYWANADKLGNSAISELWGKVHDRVYANGLRNANVSSIAPTGTTSLMMDCHTTGVEPELALIKYKTLVGGGSITFANPLVKDALTSLGYADTAIQSILDYISKNNTVLGSNLKPEHYPVFATSFGENSLHPLAHIKMVSAVQEFITEGVSKTANLPSDASVADIRDVYVKAWKMGLKAISVYRDGCKAAQPLNTKKNETKVATAPITTRRRLPAERKAIVHKIDLAGMEVYLTVGLYDDGTPGEVFITSSKAGSTISGLLDTIAILISMSLQHNVPLTSMVAKLTNTRFEPAGFTKNENIPVASSIIDYVFKWLDGKFISQKAVVQHADGMGIVGDIIDDTRPVLMKAKVLTGELCGVCGTLLVRSGTCLTCTSCGTTSGGCS